MPWSLNVCDLEPISDRGYAYRVTGDSPLITLYPKFPMHAVTGWYMLEIHVSGFAGDVYWKIGGKNNASLGLREEGVRVSGGRVTKRLLYIPEYLSEFYLHIPDAQQEFNITKFRLIPVTSNFAVNRMIKKLHGNGNLVREVDGLKEQYLNYVDTESKLDKVIYEHYRKNFITGAEDAYEHWMRHIESASLPTLDQGKKNADDLSTRPLISIVMSAYNTKKPYLELCIDSVQKQVYTNWELCIADDASDSAYVKQVLSEYSQKDARIKVIERKYNGHISASTNSALSIAKGEFVAFLDHDDELSPFALYYVVKEINNNPDLKLIYSDEDKIDAFGNRSSPHFKSDWNPDLLLSQNYINHLTVIKTSLVVKVGCLREGFEGAQDHDLLLRCSSLLSNNQIIRIPRVLYHWRQLESSTSENPESKPYTQIAGTRALKDYFRAENIKDVEVKAAGILPNTYRVYWPLPQELPLVSIIIPTRDRKDLIQTVVDSILANTDYKNYEILIIDNQSTEKDALEYFDYLLDTYSNVRVIKYDHPFNYSAITNYAVDCANGEIVGLVNNDIEVMSSYWLSEMVSHAIRPEIGCVGAKLYYSNDTIQHGGVILGLGGVAGHSHKHLQRDNPGYYGRLILVQDLSAVTAACLLVKKSIFKEVGGFDEDNLRVAFNDVDFCLKVLSKGYRNLWTPYAELYHHESLSRGYEDSPGKIKRFEYEIQFMQEKWGDVLEKDKYYNPNLTTSREDFSIALH
jgi:glycosyltransferase involved in cell wall biosynthesis